MNVFDFGSEKVSHFTGPSEGIRAWFPLLPTLGFSCWVESACLAPVSPVGGGPSPQCLSPSMTPPPSFPLPRRWRPCLGFTPPSCLLLTGKTFVLRWGLPPNNTDPRVGPEGRKRRVTARRGLPLPSVSSARSPEPSRLRGDRVRRPGHEESASASETGKGGSLSPQTQETGAPQHRMGCRFRNAPLSVRAACPSQQTCLGAL